MIKKLLIPGLIILSLLLVALYQYQKYRVAPKAELTNLNCTDTSGKNINLSSLKGKKIILTFFASWCGDCLLEMKQLNEALKNNLKDVEVIAVSEEPMEKIIAFSEKKKYPYTFLHLNEPFSNIGIYAIPVTYIINKNGEIVYSKVGAINWKDNSIVSFTENIFESK